MRLGYTMAETRGGLDPLLEAVAARGAARGLRLAGIVQVNSDRPGCARCDMDARVLPDGPTIRISQSLGAEARGCRLDPEGLERAVAAADTRLAEGADLLLVNKFGKHEAQGRGFRAPIATALGMGIPVLVGVNAMNLDALIDFAGPLAERVPADVDALLDWALAGRQSAA